MNSHSTSVAYTSRRALVALIVLVIGCKSVESDVIDGFETTDAWTLIAADGVDAEIVEVDGALRLDYDFTAGAGYCVVRRSVHLNLDPNFRFGFRFRGTGPPNTLEFKLIDESGENVWWYVQRGIEFPTDWESVSMRRRHFAFAWGPSGGEQLETIGGIEIAVTASQGGKGSIWIDDLIYEQLPDIEPQPIEPHATTGAGNDLGRVGIDGSIMWTSEHDDYLTLSFDQPVEFSAIELDWADHATPDLYHALVSAEGEIYKPILTVRNPSDSTNALFTPETEAISLRLVVPNAGAQLNSIKFIPVEELTNANDYFSMIASRSTRGHYPRYYQSLSPWTVIGLPDHPNEALVAATGAIEPIKSGYSLEPFLVHEGKVSTWSDATITQSLDSQSLPIPSVHWKLDGLNLDITALVTQWAHGDQVLARYQITNTSNRPQTLTLALAARPFQVLPAAQMLNTIGGAAVAEFINIQQDQILLDGNLFALPHSSADAVMTTDAPDGSIVKALANKEYRRLLGQRSNGQFSSGALLYDLQITPGSSSSVVVSLPMSQVTAYPPVNQSFQAALDHERTRWESLLGRTEILVPDSASKLRDIVRANLAYILVNADNPGIQPGSRTYERSWIRDGSMTSAALIALGHADTARAFIEWYSDHQYSNGKVPCVIDARGPDPVDENDAPGEFIFAIRNIAHAQGGFDKQFARAMYPKVRAAMLYIESLRNQRLSDEYTLSQEPILRACVGLMPESISHEGYSAKPMHSYWDDFWIYRGCWDAVKLAELLDEVEDQARFEVLAESFEQSLAQSVQHTTQIHGIDYIPGCVELGDFDATSSSIALYPTGAAAVLDPVQLQSTFEHAWVATQLRINGDPWDGMTPYEVRLIGTFIRLGWIERAHEYLDWLIERQDPSGWHQWGEIAYRESDPARFVGDMPHTWVGSGAILSIMSMFAYEQDDTMVLAQGIPTAWLEANQTVGVRGMTTRFGTLGYTLCRNDGVLVIEIESGHEPPDGYRLDVSRFLESSDPRDASDRLTIEVDGIQLSAIQNGMVIIPRSANRVVIRHCNEP